MNNDFSQPQRQSLVGVVIMFADTMQKALRASWPVLIVVLLRIDQTNKLLIGLGVAAVVLIAGVVAYLKYRNFTFHLDEESEEFVIRKGILNKTRIAIPLDKIQQVNINQSLIQKIIGVHEVEVDTAGSSKKEVSIRAITHGLALSLKARLMEERRQITGDNNTDTQESGRQADEAPFIQISLLSLIKTGITSNYVRSFALLIAFVATAYQYIDDFLHASQIEEDSFEEYVNPELILKFISFIIVGIIVLTLLVNLVRTIIKYFNFRITRQQDSLLLSYGLLNTKNTIIRPAKVQVVTVGRNYFQKKLNIQDIKVSQAAGDDADAQEKKKSAIEIPGCSEEEKDILLRFLLEALPKDRVVVKPSIRKVIMECVRLLILPVLIFYLAYYFVFPNIIDYAVYLPVYIVFVGLMLFFAFRNSRLFVSNNFIVKQSGAWDVDRNYIAPHKIQSISMTQFFWHRSSDIGTVTLHTAGGDFSFGLANYTRLKGLVNYWLYQVETTDKNWM